MRYVIFVVIAVLLTACDTKTGNAEVTGMFFNKAEAKKYVIASPIRGVLQRNGEPLANIKMVRRLRWNGNEEGLLQEVTTDDIGTFEFPLHEEVLSITILAQFVAKADIRAEVNSEKIKIWYSTKFLEELYDDTVGKNLNSLICDLNSEKIRVRHGASKISTICRWDGALTKLES